MYLSATRKMLTTAADIRRPMLVPGVTVTGAHFTRRKAGENILCAIQQCGHRFGIAEARRNHSFINASTWYLITSLVCGVGTVSAYSNAGLRCWFRPGGYLRQIETQVFSAGLISTFLSIVDYVYHILSLILINHKILFTVSKAERQRRASVM